jgi:hypothetical protein
MCIGWDTDTTFPFTRARPAQLRPPTSGEPPAEIREAGMRAKSRESHDGSPSSILCGEAASVPFEIRRAIRRDGARQDSCATGR